MYIVQFLDRKIRSEIFIVKNQFDRKLVLAIFLIKSFFIFQ